MAHDIWWGDWLRALQALQARPDTPTGPGPGPGPDATTGAFTGAGTGNGIDDDTARQVAELLGLDLAARAGAATDERRGRGTGHRGPAARGTPSDATAPPAPPAPPGTAGAPAGPDAAAQPPTPDDGQGTPRNDWRLPSRLQPLEPLEPPATTGPGTAAGAHPAPPGWPGLAPLRPVPSTPRPPPSLLPPRRRRALLAALLARPVAEGAPDLPRIVAALSAGQVLQRLPRLPRRTLRHGARVWVDHAPWLQPYAADQDGLVADLRRLLPPGRLQVVDFQGDPWHPARPDLAGGPSGDLGEDAWDDAAPSGPGRANARPRDQTPPAAPTAPDPRAGKAPLLLLSDLGQGAWLTGQAPPSAASWRRWARAQHTPGQRVRALSPRPGRAGLASHGVVVWHWHEGLGVPQVTQRADRGPPPARRPTPGTATAPPHEAVLRRLARCVAPAQQISPWLLRSARRALQPPLPPAVEAELWFSPLVHTRSTQAVALAPALRRSLLDELLSAPASEGHNPNPVLALPARVADANRADRALAMALLRSAWPDQALPHPLNGQPTQVSHGAQTFPNFQRAEGDNVPGGAQGAPAADGRAALAPLEDALTAAALAAAEAGAAVDEAALQALLAPALKALAARQGASAARDVASWAVHAWQRLPAVLKATEPLRLLLYAAARHLRPQQPAAAAALLAGAHQALEPAADPAASTSAAPPSPPPLPGDSPWTRAVLGTDDAPPAWISLELRQYADGSTNLVVGPARAPTTALHRLALPLAGPLWLQVSGGHDQAGQPLHAPPRLLAIDPGSTQQIEVPDSSAAAPLTLQALGTPGWRLWRAGSLWEAVAPAFLTDPRGRLALLLDAQHALLWPDRPGPPDDDTTPDWRPWDAPGPRTRLRRLPHPAMSHGGPLWLLQALEAPATAVPLDLDGWPELPTAGDHPYLALPSSRRGPQADATLAYRGEGSYLPPAQALDRPGLLLPGYGRAGPMLVHDPSVADERTPAPVLPQALAALRDQARAQHPGCHQALLVAMPGAEQPAFALYDTLLSALAHTQPEGGRVVHDPDGAWSQLTPPQLAERLRPIGLVVVVGAQPPQGAQKRVLEAALGLQLQWAWLPLVPDDAAAALRHTRWPAALAQALHPQQAWWLSGEPHSPQLAATIAHWMDGPPPAAAPDRTPAEATGQDTPSPLANAPLTNAPPATGLAPTAAPTGWAHSARSLLLRKLDPRPDDQIGLFRVRPLPDGQADFEPATWPTKGPPGLLMLHGELSDTAASFGDLWRTDDGHWRRLREAYGDQLYAWRWRTAAPGLARQARNLPPLQGAPVHLLTLGAGGLLPELLLVAGELNADQAEDWAERIWAGAPDVPAVRDDRDALRRWPALRFYAGRPPDIQRFVRVACPGAGTPIYTQGLDRWLKVFNQLPGLSWTSLLLPDTVLDDPAALPGLAGLAPGAGVLPLLQAPLTTDTPLAIVAGSHRPAGRGGWLKALGRMALGLGGKPSDLVVPLPSAFAGIERRGGVDWLVDEGPDTTHFGYLRHAPTRRAIVDALLHEPGRVPGFAHAPSLRALQAEQGLAVPPPAA